MRALEIMLLAAVASAAQQQPRPRWSYDTNNRRNGPGSWPGICDQHRSSKQSPIDISLTGHEVRRVRPFLMDGFEDAAETVIDTNDTTVKVTLAPREKKRRLSGGDLVGQYEFSQLHFHWGDQDTIGSEHMISDEAWPFEMHMVHFNTKYGRNYSAATEKGVNDNDTLAVLSVLFRVTTWDNPGLEPIVKALEERNQDGGNNRNRNNNNNNQNNVDNKQQKQKRQQKKQEEKLVLSRLLPSYAHSFFRYEGSLTTPPCSEFVLWSVFRNPADISRRQLNVFREAARNNRRMTNNFRRTKPIKRRLVVEMFSGTAAPAATTAAAVLAAAAALLAN